MSIAPAFLTLSSIGDDEQRRIEAASAQLSRYRIANLEAEAFYEGTFVPLQFGISIPPSMQGVQTPVGWGGTVVDSLEERLDWLGWHSEADDYGLAEVYAENQLDVESGMTHLDSLIYGVSFVSTGNGFDGEPSPLVTANSPKSMTGTWDRRARRLSDAVAFDGTGEGATATLYKVGETVTYEMRAQQWRVIDRDRHGLSRVPVSMMPNRVRASRSTGRSEITKAVRYYCEAAARTLLGMEVSREFYNAPKIVGLNMTEEAFQNQDGTPASQWTAIMGRIWTAPPNEDGEAPPDVKQLTAASPMPYLDQIKGYATYTAADAGIPVSRFGFATDNPPSADAIRAQESREVKRAERRQGSFGYGWMDVGANVLAVRDGRVPDDFRSRVSAKWRDAATPTRAASADEAAKLIGAGVLPADSSVTMDRVGLSPAEQRQLVADRRRSSGREVVQALRAQPAFQQQPEQPVSDGGDA